LTNIKKCLTFLILRKKFEHTFFREKESFAKIEGVLKTRSTAKMQNIEVEKSISKIIKLHSNRGLLIL